MKSSPCWAEWFGKAVSVWLHLLLNGAQLPAAAKQAIWGRSLRSLRAPRVAACGLISPISTAAGLPSQYPGLKSTSLGPGSVPESNA